MMKEIWRMAKEVGTLKALYRPLVGTVNDLSPLQQLVLQLHGTIV